ELAILETHDVGRDPGRGPASAGEPSVRDHVVSLGDDQMVFVAERVGEAANKIEQAIAAWRDMGAMLDVALRPEALCGNIVALIEKRVEGFEHEGLVLFRCRCGHVLFREEKRRPHQFSRYLARNWFRALSQFSIW